MSLVISVRSEILKSKRTSAFWLTIFGAAFVPGIIMLSYVFSPAMAAKTLAANAWQKHFISGWQNLNTFLFPMFVVLICTLIPQIEFKNNTWKQVFASPQSYGEIFFSKFITIQLLILLFFFTFNVLMILAGMIPGLFNSQLPFLQHPIDWASLMKMSAQTYLSALGISAIQYWLALRFRSFIAPVGIGLALVLGSVIAFSFGWKYANFLPYALPAFTLKSIIKQSESFLKSAEIVSVVFMAEFLIIGFIDLLAKKEKG